MKWKIVIDGVFATGYSQKLIENTTTIARGHNSYSQCFLVKFN